VLKTGGILGENPPAGTVFDLRGAIFDNRPRMRTKISPENPHAHNRYGFAWEMVPAGSAHLDFGCYDGAFLAKLANKRLARRVGVDANAEALAAGRRAHPDLELHHQTHAVPLDFADGSFDSITLLDVLEHVVEQEALLREFHRLLRPGGTLVVTVPGQHLFSFLDLGNLKFRFPGLHRWWYSRKHGREAYERRYAANPDGMIGDISAEKAWHEHFSQAKLGALLRRAGFAVERFDGTAFFRRILLPIQLTAGRVAAIHAVVQRIEKWDARTFSSANLFCAARKNKL
jgi:SAM-dependent methyltransferase